MYGAPSLAGFITFLRTVVGITTTVLPDNSAVIPMAYEIARTIVNPALACVGGPPFPPQANPVVSIYALAVYNLGTDNVYNYAQDLPGAAIIPGSVDPATGIGLPFFAYARKTWNIFGFVSGVVESTGDETTNVSLVVQEAAKNFTLSDLQNLKTPYGRRYLSMAQQYGPTIWGLS